MEIGKEINKLSRKIVHIIDGMKNSYGLSSASLRVLGYLAHNDIVYQGDFEDILHIRRSSISSILSNLEAKGYIERYTDETDTRRKRVILTDLGFQVEHETFKGTIGKIEEALSNCLTETELEAFFNTLDKLNAALDEIQKEELDD